MFIIIPLLILLLSITFLSCKDPEPIPEVENPPTLLTPLNDAEVGSTDPVNFTWTGVENADTYTLTYEILGGSAGPIKIEDITDVYYTTNYTDLGMSIGDSIRWSVTAVGLVNQMKSADWQFRIKDDIAPVIDNFEILSPYYDPTHPDVAMFGSGQTVEFAAKVEDTNEVLRKKGLFHLMRESRELDPDSPFTAVVSDVPSIDISISDYTVGDYTHKGTFTLPTGAEKLIAGQSYTIEVTALDAEGNTSVRTLPFIIDDVEPYIENLTLTNIGDTDDDTNMPMYASGTSATYEVDIYDNIALATTDGYTAVVTDASGAVESEVTVSIALQSGNHYTGTFDLPIDNKKYNNWRNLDKNKIYSLKITALDEEGNEAVSITNFKIDFVAPIITEIITTINPADNSIKDGDTDVIALATGSTVTVQFETTITDNIPASLDPSSIFAGIYDGSEQIDDTAVPDNDPNDLENFTFSNTTGDNYEGSFDLPETSTLTPGKPYKIKVTAEDNDGNVSVMDSTFKLDSVPPEVLTLEITGPDTEADGVSIFKDNDNVTYEATAQENIPGGSVADATAEIYGADGAVVAGITVTAVIGPESGGIYPITGSFNTGTGLTDGATYTLRLTTEDDNGNSGFYSIQFKIDKTNPSSVEPISYENDGNVIEDFGQIRFINDTFIINGSATDNVKVKKVHAIVERDGDDLESAPTITQLSDIEGIPTNGWSTDDGGGNQFKRFVAAGEEDWSAGIELNYPGGSDGAYFVWLAVEDIVGNVYLRETTGTPAPVPFNILGTIPNRVEVDMTPPDFTIWTGYDDGTGDPFNKYADYNSMSNAWTVSHLLLPQADRQYRPYSGTIDEDNYYNPDPSATLEQVHYVDWNGSEYDPDYDTENDSVLSLVDLDICEIGSANKKITVEIGIDGVFEAPFVVYTSSDTCDIGSGVYNADVGYRHDTLMGETGATGRLSNWDNSGAYESMDSTDHGIYRFNLLDFPKGTGNMVADGQHQITYRLTDEAGNTTEKFVYVHTRLMNRPYLAYPNLNGSTTRYETFHWYHPKDISDVSDSPDRIAFGEFVTSYYLDFSSEIPVSTDPGIFEASMVSMKLTDSNLDPDSLNFTIDNGNNEIDSENIDLANHPDLGSGMWYWRIRAVMENALGEPIYEIGSDNLPFALQPGFDDPANNHHELDDSHIHDLRVGNIYPPNIDSPHYGEYFGTSETIRIEWSAPTQGEVTDPAEIDGYRLQMRPLSPQGEDGGWVDILGYYDSNNDIHVPESQTTLDVNKASAPVNSNYGMYQYRIRTVDYDILDDIADASPVSGWAYSFFVYTPDSAEFDSHINVAEGDGGMPISVRDTAISDTGNLIIASQVTDANKIWVFDDEGEIITSIDLGTLKPEAVVSATEQVALDPFQPDVLTDVEVIYFLAEESSQMYIKKINFKNQIAPDYEISNFDDIGLPEYISQGDVVGLDYFDGNLYTYYNDGSDEKIIEISTAVNDSYVELADLSGIVDYDGLDALGDVTHFEINSVGQFFLLNLNPAIQDIGGNPSWLITKLAVDGQYSETFNLNETFVSPPLGDPIAGSIVNTVDFDVYGVEMNIAMKITEPDGSDTIPPVLADTDGLVIDGDTLIMTYNEGLNEGSVPALTDIVVNVDGVDAVVSSIVITGSIVTVTLEDSVTSTDPVLLSYTAGDTPIQDVYGNNAANLIGEDVTNNTVADTEPPTLSQAEINGATLTLTYNEALDELSVPAITDYTVNVNSSPATIITDGVTVDGSTVVITLDTAVVLTDVVTITYVKGVDPLRDTSGNEAPEFTDYSVVNNTAKYRGVIRRKLGRFGDEMVKVFILTPSGGVKEPIEGYDGSDLDYDIARIGVGVDYIIAQTYNETDSEEHIYKILKDSEALDYDWADNGYIIGGGEWDDSVVSVPGGIGVRDIDTDDGYSIAPADDEHVYLIDKSTQQVVKVGGSNYKRSDGFSKLSGIAVSSRVGESRGIFVTDELANAVYQLRAPSGSTLEPVTSGSFDDNGKLDESVFYNYYWWDDDGDPETPDVIQVVETDLSQPKGIHLEPRIVNGAIREYLYIADYGNDRIVCLMLTQNGTQVTKIYNDVTNGSLVNPIDVAVFDRDAMMYVLTEGGEVLVFRRQYNNYQYRYSWSVPYEATAIDSDQFGCVYVTTKHGVYKWGFEEWPYYTWGNEQEKPMSDSNADGLIFGGSMPGDGDMAFNMPTGLSVGLKGWIQAWDDGSQTGKNYDGMRLFIADSYNRRIKILNKTN